MRLLLDTVTFLEAAASPEHLSRKAMSMLAREDIVREISVVCLSEIAMKQSRGKLTFGKDVLARAIAALRLRVLPYTGEHAYGLFDLPMHHADPFDRQIIAQALVEDSGRYF